MLVPRYNRDQQGGRNRAGGHFGAYADRRPAYINLHGARPPMRGLGLSLGMRNRDPLDPLSQGGLGGTGGLGGIRGLGGVRHNDPVARAGQRRSEPFYETVDPLHRKIEIDRIAELRRDELRREEAELALLERQRRQLHDHRQPVSILGRSCDECLPIGRRCDSDRGHRCARDYTCNCTSSKFESRGKKTYDFKTKDITVRGKSYAVRKSFLADSNKFEADLIKYVDKKKEEQLPSNVVGMLIQFINEEDCSYKTVLDLVLLNVLASSLGCKSVVEHSLRDLKKIDHDNRVAGDELTNICVAVMLSGKVDSGLEEWLKKFLRSDGKAEYLHRSYHYRAVLESHPQLNVKLLELLGEKPKQDGDNLPIL